MPFSTTRAALAALLVGLPLAASAQPGPPPTSPPVGTVTVDGTLTDAPYTLLATDGGRTGLGFGPDNQLNALYAHVDPATNRLDIGLAGILQRNDDTSNRNYAVIFFDTKAGGFSTGNFGRTDGPDFGQGVSNFSDTNAFDDGFTADYALQIGCGASDCYVSLFTLAGTAAGGGGSTLFIGTTADPDVAVNLPTAAQDSRTQGFEISLTYSADGTGADLALDRNSVQMFAFITGASGFFSDQFLSPTDAGDGNYGFDSVDFETKEADPVSLVWQPIAGRHGWRQLAWPVEGGVVANYAAQNHVQGPGTAFPDGESNVLLRTGSGTGDDYVRASGLTDPLTSGRGQFWYHYDMADFPGGVIPAGSNFQARPYTLVAGGTEPQQDVSTSIGETYIGFTMAGNPFSLDFDTQSATVGSGVTFGPLAYAWDPDMGMAGGYVTIDRNAAAQSDRTVAPMQGFWLETVSAPTLPLDGAPPALGGLTFIYPQAGRVQGNEPLVARSVPQRVLAFNLDRLTETGLEPEWHGARLAFVDGAGEGTDIFDGGLPPAVGPAGARIGFAATGTDGQPLYRGQESRAYDLAAPAEARLALSTPEAATYRLSWPSLDGLPADWALTLTDGDTGALLDLRTADHVDVAATAGDWTSRFTVRVEPRSTAAEAAPAIAHLGAATPNPTTGDARVALAVDRPQHVRADLVDALGRRVAVVFDGAVEAPRDLVVSTHGLAPGVYVLRVAGDTFAASRRITVAR